VTPVELITALVCEKGAMTPPDTAQIRALVAG
jgi:methylthioribose-1-phosphate isomerase